MQLLLYPTTGLEMFSAVCKRCRHFFSRFTKVDIRLKNLTQHGALLILFAQWPANQNRTAPCKYQMNKRINGTLTCLLTLACLCLTSVIIINLWIKIYCFINHQHCLLLFWTQGQCFSQLDIWLWPNVKNVALVNLKSH